MTNESVDRDVGDVERDGITPLPEDAPALADWIEMELGDEELAEYLRAHENVQLLLSGERMFPRTVFELLKDLGKTDNLPARAELAHKIIYDNYLPETSVRHITGRFDSAGEELRRRRHQVFVQKKIFELQEDEIEKNEEDRLFITRSIDAVNQFRKDAGLEPVNFSPDVAHIISQFFVTENAIGTTDGLDQRIKRGTTESSAVRFAITFHEFIHLGSYVALKVEESEVGRQEYFFEYRMGLKTSRRVQENKVESYLTSLNEAITEELTRRTMLKISPEDKELGYITVTREKNNSHLLRQAPLSDHTIREELIDTEYGEDKVVLHHFSYRSEREMMYMILYKMYKQNPERFSGKTQIEAREELFVMLTKAMFTGNILPFGRLFNETFGRGKFREFGRLQSVEEQRAFVDAL